MEGRREELDVVIVVCDGCKEDVAACLTSLEAAPPGGKFAVRVIDNASSDGTQKVVQERFPWVDYVRLRQNHGFSAANNVGIRRGAARFVLLLNPDTEVPAGTLAHLLATMRDGPQYGVVGCRLVDRHGIADHNARRTFPTVSSASRYFAGRVIPWLRAPSEYETPSLHDEQAGEVDAVSGACMLVRRHALQRVGLLDEHYWMYGEDLDWCYRFKRDGWTVLYDGRVAVIHHGGGATGVHRRLRVNVAFHLSMGRFYRKFYAGRQPLVDAMVYCAILARMAFSIVHSSTMRVVSADS